MNRTREILRLRWERGQAVRATARAVGVGRSAVSETCARATAAGLRWEGVRELADDELALSQRYSTGDSFASRSLSPLPRRTRMTPRSPSMSLTWSCKGFFYTKSCPVQDHGYRLVTQHIDLLQQLVDFPFSEHLRQRCRLAGPLQQSLCLF